MISCFPDPHPDEIFYSLCARFSDRVRYANKKSIFAELFGLKGIYPVVDLPCRLGYFVDNLIARDSYTVDYLLGRHTLEPFYGAFLPHKKRSELREQMAAGMGKSIYRRIGIATSHVRSPLWLRYCPACMEQDKASVGEPYWHRLHQVPGVEVCPIHATYLENSTIRTRGTFGIKAFIPAERAIQTPLLRIARESPFYVAMKHIATEAAFLLGESDLGFDDRLFHERYHRLLAQRGFTKRGGLIRQMELLQAFIDYYPPPLLNLLHCNIIGPVKPGSCWLSMLVTPLRNGSRHHPLHHILAIHFLGSTLKEFFHENIHSATPVTPAIPAISTPKEFFHENIHPSAPFGPGPWPCLNPVCRYYRQACISSYELTRKSERDHPIGRFSCACGFTYVRAGPDHSPDDAFRRTKISHYGEVWDAKLQELWPDAEISLNELSRRLGIVPDAIKLQAKRLQLPMPQFRLHKRRVESTDPSLYRTRWLTLLEQFPEDSLTSLQKKPCNPYTWLSRNDWEWLSTHKPPTCGPGVRKRQLRFTTQAAPKMKRRNRQEYQEYDAQMAEAIRNAANRLISAAGAPQKITGREISKVVPHLSQLRRRPEKAPLTSQALEEVLETQEAFTVRRIQWIAQRYLEEQVYPQEWEFLQRVNLRKTTLQNPIIGQAFNDAMITLSRPP